MSQVKNGASLEEVELELASFMQAMPLYTFTKIIGRGATSVVALALDKDGEKRAVKRMKFSPNAFY